MCTYATEIVPVEGSGKGSERWFRLTQAAVYYDHPQHSTDEHTLNIDFTAPERGPAARVAVELSKDAARELAETILRTLDSLPAGI